MGNQELFKENVHVLLLLVKMHIVIFEQGLLGIFQNVTALSEAYFEVILP